MTQVSQSDKIISTRLAQDESVTVPSGEVWRVNASSDHNDITIQVNGTNSLRLWQENGCGTPTTKVPLIFPGGTTITAYYGPLFLNGVEVSGTVDNTPVCEVVSSGNTVTVPSGETWYVSIGSHDDAMVDVDGSQIIRYGQPYDDGTGANQTDCRFYFEEGQTITIRYHAGLITGWSI